MENRIFVFRSVRAPSKNQKLDFFKKKKKKGGCTDVFYRRKDWKELP